MKITRTVTIDGKNADEFEQIKTHLEALKAQFNNWEITYNQLLNQATATCVEEVDRL